MRFFLTVFFSLALTACAGFAGLTPAEKAALTPEQRIFKIANEVNLAFGPAVAYASQPRCEGDQVVACYDPRVVRVLLELREEANAAIESARSNPDAAAVAVLSQTARRILGRLQAELLKTKTPGAFYEKRNVAAFA